MSSTPEQNGVIERFFRSLKEERTRQHCFRHFTHAAGEILKCIQLSKPAGVPRSTRLPDELTIGESIGLTGEPAGVVPCWSGTWRCACPLSGIDGGAESPFGKDVAKTIDRIPKSGCRSPLGWCTPRIAKEIAVQIVPLLP